MKLPWVKKHSIPPQRRRLSTERLEQQDIAERKGQKLFHRNRTLVGSLSFGVKSTGELTGDHRSPRAHVHHLTAHRRKIMSALFAVVVASCFLTWLLYDFTAEVSVTATDSISIDESRYQNAINDYFAMHPIERLRFAMNIGGLSKYLSQVVPEVAGAELGGASGFVTTQFDLLFRRPIAGWLIGQTQYYVDQDGKSFQVNYFDNPTVKIVDNSGIPQSEGTTIASGRFLRFVGRAVTLAGASNMIIKEAIIPASTTHQIEVIVKGHKYPVKLSLDRPVGEQVEDMLNAIKYFNKHHITPRYIDIRVSGEAFYR